MTKAYADAVASSPWYEPQAEFFRGVLDAVVPDGSFELWGWSTGCPISASVLQDPAYANRASQAVWLCPSSSSVQSMPSLVTGLIREMSFLKHVTETPKNMLSYKGTDPSDSDPVQKANRGVYMASLMKKIRSVFPGWKDAHVQPSGRVVVVSGGKDFVTRSEEGTPAFEKNPQASVVHIPEGSHYVPVLFPKQVIARVEKAQQGS